MKDWVIWAWLFLFGLLVLVELRHPAPPPGLSRHDECLRRIAELEAELFPLRVMSDAQFDAEIAALTMEQHARIEEDVPVCERSEQYWREVSFRIWRDYMASRRF